MSTRIVITGANSAVGQAILRAGLTRQPPPTLIAGVRSARAMQGLSTPPGGRVVRIVYEEPATLDAACAGATAVIHLAGTLVERPGSTYETANVATARAVAEAAERCGVAKIVLVSAIGADPRSRNRYLRTKGEAEAVTRAAACAHTILRVPLLLGPGTEGTAALLRHLAKPAVKLPGGGRNRQQPLHVDDLARAALRAADPAVARNRTLELVGPESLPDREILERAAAVLGRPVRIGSVPILPLRLILGLQRLVSGPGFSPDVLDVITADTHLDFRPAADELGIPLTGLDETIRASVASTGRRTTGA